MESFRRDIFGVAIVAALIALALAFGAQRGRRAVAVAPRSGEASALSGTAARYTFTPTSGRLDVVTADGRSRIELELSLVVDGIERPLAMRKGDVHLKDKQTLIAEFPIELGDERATGTLELRMDPLSDLVTATLSVVHEAGSSAHTYALRCGLAPEGRAVFVPGSGAVSDATTVEARTVIVDDDAHPFAILSGQGPLTIAEPAPDMDQPGARSRVIVSARAETAAMRATGAASGKPARLDVSVLVGASNQQIWGRLHRLQHLGVARVSGGVTGTKERAHVFALDEEGRPQVRAITDAQGRFVIEAPTTAVQWFAALEAVHTSAPVRFAPGSPWDLRLDVSAGGELALKVTDGDTGKPLIARLIVKGVEGTLDPNFGPDYRASGAGPLMDVLEGEVTTPLPAGKYRVSVTKGIEWSIDSEIVEIASGRTKPLELALRHVVLTPGSVGCDLHVHARPSFDSFVSPEDRVLSLISAGVDFAVPTEHNIVGDYGPALDTLRLTKQLAHVPGVEVTTHNPRLGHFGVFPYPVGSNVPAFRGTNAGALVTSSHRGDPNRVVQINHPRLSGIGYFNIVSFDPKSGRVPAGMRSDFDTLEVYNGYELSRRELTERIMEDWFALLNLGRRFAATGSSDSHRIMYQWAGYPRTYALVDAKSAGDTGQGIETKEVVAAIKKGRSFVTSGPMIELELAEGGRRATPGDELAAPRSGALTGKIRVRAAPWVDITSVELLAGLPPSAPSNGSPSGSTTSIFKRGVPSRPTELGKEQGKIEEVAAHAIRFESDLSLKLPEGTRWVIAIVRGDRRLDDALPFMPVQPLGFTNPIWIGH